MAKPTNTVFEVEDTLSTRWAYPGDKQYETVSFIQVKDADKSPKNVVEPLLTFQFFKRHVKHKRDDYEILSRIKFALYAYAFILGVGAIISALTVLLSEDRSFDTDFFTGALSFTVFMGGIVGIIFLAFFTEGKYVHDFEDSDTFNNAYNAITVFSEDETCYPRWHDPTKGLTSPSHAFYSGKYEHVSIMDEELYQTVKAYVLSALEAKKRGDEDTESKELYSSLADYAIRSHNRWKSKQLIKDHSTLSDSMSEEYENVQAELVLTRDSLIQKFKQAREYYDNLSEYKLKADAQNLLYSR